MSAGRGAWCSHWVLSCGQGGAAELVHGVLLGAADQGVLGRGAAYRCKGFLLPLEQVMLLRVRTGGFWSMGFCLILRPTGGCEGGWVTVYGC